MRAAAPELGSRDGNLQAMFHMFATANRVMGLGFLLVGSVIGLMKKRAPAEVSAAGVWEHLGQLTVALPYVDISSRMSLSQSNLLGHDWY